MKVQIAFDRPLNENVINFLRIGRTIWPVRSVQISAPLHFSGKRRSDKYGLTPVTLRSELVRGVNMDSGEIYAIDHRGKQMVFSYFNPKDRPEDLPKNMWPMVGEGPSFVGGDDDDDDDDYDGLEMSMGAMTVMTHQYMSLVDQSVLICTEYNDGNPGDQQIIIDPETPCAGDGGPVDTYDDYIRRFGEA